MSCLSIPPPPSDEVLERYAAGGARASGDSTPLHFFAPGPADVRPVRRHRIRLRDGTTRAVTWTMPWYLDRVEGTTRATALRRLYDVLLAPQGWTRAGVHWARVTRREDAAVIVRVIPQDTTACGPGSAGCYSWGYEPDGKPVAEIGVEYIDRPGPWAALVQMELCGHGTVRADDQYTRVHQPYRCGVMGDWPAVACAGYMPTPAEIEASIQWLRGETPADRVHWH